MLGKRENFKEDKLVDKLMFEVDPSNQDRSSELSPFLLGALSELSIITAHKASWQPISRRRRSSCDIGDQDNASEICETDQYSTSISKKIWDIPESLENTEGSSLVSYKECDIKIKSCSEQEIQQQQKQAYFNHVHLNIPVMQRSDNEKWTKANVSGEQPVDFYINLFLKLVDNKLVDHTVDQIVSKSHKLSIFKHCVLESIRDRKSAGPDNDIEVKAGRRLGGSCPKRKDQMLRLVFASSLKILLDREQDSARLPLTNEQALEMFCAKHSSSKEDEDQLIEFIQKSKFPSRKGLWAVFWKYPSLRQNFHDLLYSGDIHREYHKKRVQKASQIVEKFDGLYHIHPDDPPQITKKLSSCFTSLPWSSEDIEKACDVLGLVVPKEDHKISYPIVSINSGKKSSGDTNGKIYTCQPYSARDPRCISTSDSEDEPVNDLKPVDPQKVTG